MDTYDLSWITQREVCFIPEQNGFACLRRSAEALIDDIDTDKKVAILSLTRPAYARFASDDFFMKIDI